MSWHDCEQRVERLEADLALVTKERDILIADISRKAAPFAKALADAHHEIRLLKAAPPAEGPTWQQVREKVSAWRGAALYERNKASRNGDEPSIDIMDTEVRAFDSVLSLLPTPPRDPAGKDYSDD